MDVFTQLQMPSHHPLREGKMECSSCHDFTGKRLFEKERVNDTCLKCHQKYRGPYVFEHAPVVENCTICHAPHGAVADKLLIQNEPFVCLSCHQMHFHTQLAGYRGKFTSPIHEDRGGVSTSDAFKRSMLTKCTQCHAQVHGSDLPAQGISGSGKSLTR
jgi:DmsE family decaheme c-type cytochrome